MRRFLLTMLLLAPTPALAIPNPAMPAPEGRWYAVQRHAHSRYSDGVHPLGDLVRWAREGGLDAIAITDHNTNRHLADPVYKQDQGITLIPAYEWTELEGPNGQHLTPVAVCDFHVGTPVQAVVSPCTLVWARSRKVEDLLGGLKAGHVTLVEEPHGPRVELWGEHDALPGDTVPKGSKLQLRVTGAQGETVTLYDAGGTALTRQVPSDPYVETLPAARPGFYYARLDRQRPYNPLLSMTGAIFVK